MPNGSDRVTSHSLQELQPTKTVDDPEIKSWLALGIKTKKKGGGKKKKGEDFEFTQLGSFLNYCRVIKLLKKYVSFCSEER